jgi:hypothetical protein
MMGCVMLLNRKKVSIFCGLTGLVLTISASAALAQSSYSASSMWGAAPGGVAVQGAAESSTTHLQDAAVAGAVNAAQNGWLNSGVGSNLTISSVGSQTIVDNTVYGSSNNVNLNNQQTSSSSGNVSNQGDIKK